MADKPRHAFGDSVNVDKALKSGVINAFDILFLDGDTAPKIGWIDANGEVRIAVGSGDITGEAIKEVIRVEELPTVNGDKNVIYIFNNECYVWNGTQCVSVCKPVDLTELEKELSKLESVLDNVQDVEYEIFYKPNGTLVDYRDKEIRIMCPSDTKWEFQNSGQGADANKYYIGFKAYAPSDDVISFKEDLAKTINDTTMYYFENNDFAGVESDTGRKYSIVWLPVATFADNNWSYYGVNSTIDKYIGWNYSVEWYNADGLVIASDCIKINLSNENCHSLIEPYYVNDAIQTAKDYTDAKIQEMSGIGIIEF